MQAELHKNSFKQDNGQTMSRVYFLWIYSDAVCLCVVVSQLVCRQSNCIGVPAEAKAPGHETSCMCSCDHGAVYKFMCHFQIQQLRAFFENPHAQVIGGSFDVQLDNEKLKLRCLQDLSMDTAAINISKLLPGSRN